MTPMPALMLDSSGANPEMQQLIRLDELRKQIAAIGARTSASARTRKASTPVSAEDVANMRNISGRAGLARNMVNLAGMAGVSPETLQGRVPGTGDMSLVGPIAPSELRQMIAKSQFNQRMGVDPQAARWRAMLANPAKAQADPAADTPDDVARKAALGRLALINGKRIPADEVSSGMMSDMRGQERGRYQPGSDFMQQRANRMKRGSAAADASRAKSADLAFRRGVLNPTAETALAQEGVIPDRQAMAVAQRIALAQAMQHPGNVDPMKAIMARWLSNPANMDTFMKNRMGGGEATPEQAPVQTGTPRDTRPPGIYNTPDGTITVLPGGGTIRKRKPPVDPNDVQPAPFW